MDGTSILLSCESIFISVSAGKTLLDEDASFARDRRWTWVDRQRERELEDGKGFSVILITFDCRRLLWLRKKISCREKNRETQFETSSCLCSVVCVHSSSSQSLLHFLLVLKVCSKFNSIFSPTTTSLFPWKIASKKKKNVNLRLLFVSLLYIDCLVQRGCLT